MEKTVVELFAGVGGFRVGLNRVSKFKKNGLAIEKNDWNFVFSNQWEPSSKIQHAFECYEKRFGKSEAHSNLNIWDIESKKIPDHNLLVGGFPCQDYSVARGLSGEKGIDGEKGSLWFKIIDIIKIKKPSFILLENVDRILKSPSTQRGRDFAMILRTLNDNEYSVEWRVINAADYGFVQRRRRTFIFAFHKSTKYYLKSKKTKAKDYIYDNGFFQKQFPIEKSHSVEIKECDISSKQYSKIEDIYNGFSFCFENSGVMHNGKIATFKTIPLCKKQTVLADIIVKDKVNETYLLSPDKIEKFEIMKGSKRIERKKPNSNETYIFAEGKISFPDDINKPARTMLTSEGTTNRSSHIINDYYTGRKRFILPIEAERINGFPDEWTNTGMTERKRFFMMGNALVVDLIKEMEKTLTNIFENEA